MSIAPTPEAALRQDSSPQAPQWLLSSLQAIRSQYPHDQIVLRQVAKLVNTPGMGNEENITTTVLVWRIACLDCPGKLYSPGPNETLSNFEVHMKNRQHRKRVNERIALARPTDNVPAPADINVVGIGNSSGDSPAFLLSSL